MLVWSRIDVTASHKDHINIEAAPFYKNNKNKVKAKHNEMKKKVFPAFL